MLGLGITFDARCLIFGLLQIWFVAVAFGLLFSVFDDVALSVLSIRLNTLC